MTKNEMLARLVEVLAELDKTKDRLLRSGVPKAAIPLILGASMGGCGSETAVYGAPCDGDCGSSWGGDGGTSTSTGGDGGGAFGGSGGAGGALGGAGGVGGAEGGAGGSGGAGGA